VSSPAINKLLDLPPAMVLEIVNNELARRSLYHFIKVAWKYVNPYIEFKDNWHINCIAEHLEAVTRGDIQKLLIGLPPRHAKSLIVSVFWFAWVWMRDPASQWIYASYSLNLTIRDSVRCRDLVKHPWYRERADSQWSIKADVDGKEWFANTAGGSRICTTPEMAGAGLDADYAICDDPNNVRDRYQPNKLRATNRWWGETMTTRFNDPSKVKKVICQQRIAVNDLTGHQLANELGYEYLCLPVKYEPHRYFEGWEEAKASKVEHPIVPTILQRQRPELRDPRREGEMLWANRFTGPIVEEMRKELGDSAPGQLDLRPAAEHGAIFRKAGFRNAAWGKREVNGETLPVVILYDGLGGERYVPLKQIRFFQTVDTAMTESNHSDYTVVGTFGVTPDSSLILFDIFRERLEVPDQFGALVAMRQGLHRWNREQRKMMLVKKWERHILFQAVEPKASGIGLIQQGVREGNAFKILKVDGDKRERAVPLSTLMENGGFYVLGNQAWRADFETELLAFPTGEHDDQVDITAYAGYLVNHDAILKMFSDQAIFGDDGSPLSVPSVDINLRGGGKHTVYFDDED
jgi:predicted phage terminase large subunit-like protein